MKNFVQPGEHIDVTLTGAVSSGDFLVVGNMTGVAQGAGVADDTIAIVRRGVFTLPKLAAQAWTVGQRVYWDAGNSRMTTVASGNTLVGVAAAVAADPSDTGDVLLDGVIR